jgi:hypothetical protein
MCGGVNLPVSLAPQHPRHFLTPTGHEAGGFLLENVHGALASNTVEAERAPEAQPAIREAEVMYHFYKNGRLGTPYHRKASTVFMVNLFNDLLSGSSPGSATLDAAAGTGNPNGDKAPTTDTIRSFSAGGQSTLIFFSLFFFSLRSMHTWLQLRLA